MIKIENLDFSYKHTPVFRNINLEFQKGSIYGLLGENGVGKTTMLKIISGLLRPSSGICSVDNLLSQDRQPMFLENIFFLPDEVHSPANSTPEKFINDFAPFYPKYNPEVFRDLMKELEVDPTWKFKEMSFGQQKKSLIACALSLGTDYVLLDEPTNGLDIPSKADFRKLLSKRSNEETTIIISTHQVKDVENLIDPIIILSNDDVLLNASIQEITSKLFFEYGGQKREDALYSEMLPGGFLNVLPNINHEDSAVNIEALFNAVLRNKQTVKDIFNR